MLDLLAFAKRNMSDQPLTASRRRKGGPPRLNGMLTALNCGEKVNPSQLSRDPRNIHKLSEGTIRCRLHDQGLREIHELLGPVRKGQPLKKSRRYTLSDGTTGTTVELHRDPRNVLQLSRTTIEGRVRRAPNTTPEHLYGPAGNNFASKRR
jgi:hypothetical protein